MWGVILIGGFVCLGVWILGFDEQTKKISKKYIFAGVCFGIAAGLFALPIWALALKLVQ